MLDAFLAGLQGLADGMRHLDGAHIVMIALAGVMFYLAVAKDVEPLLLLPIGFGCLLANLPLSELMHEGGVLKTMYDFGIGNELFPLLIFIGIGSMTDFTPLLANPKLLLFGAAGQPLGQRLLDLTPTSIHEHLEEALDAAWSASRPGDVILFSPAFSSFDQFPNFAARAARFDAWVHDLLRRGGTAGRPAAGGQPMIRASGPCDPS